MANLQELPPSLVKDFPCVSASLLTIHRSYFIWSILVFLVFLSQGVGIVEKLWIKVWGEAYGSSTSSFMFNAFSSSGQEILAGGSHTHGMLHHHISHAELNLTTSTLPNAREHPFFYVGVYAAIGIGSAMIGVASSAVQYTGALKASRILFKYVGNVHYFGGLTIDNCTSRQLLVTVVRATFRFHDTTPQGRMLNRFGKVHFCFSERSVVKVL